VCASSSTKPSRRCADPPLCARRRRFGIIDAMLRRRDLLCRGAALWAATSGLARADDESAAFDADTFAAALRAYGLAVPPIGQALTLKALDLVEDGATVEVGVASMLAGAQRWLLLVEKNPNPLAARFDLDERVVPQLTLRLRVAQSCDLWALALLPGAPAVAARRAVAVTLGGCGEGEIANDLPPLDTAPRATRIRVRRQGAGADVRMLMSHPMETGLRKDPAGRPVPAWHIRDLSVTLNGAVLLRARCGPSLSRNPYLQFGLKNAAPGDLIGVDWTDTRGARRHDETSVG